MANAPQSYEAITQALIRRLEEVSQRDADQLFTMQVKLRRGLPWRVIWSYQEEENLLQRDTRQA